ncbi:MAG TPA: hypothetical protein DEA55_11900 [Rhodospirillaceae bacterium]|nr:hypothetical protein [Rhodospirillaceae bacterium]
MNDHDGDISSIESVSAPGVEPGKMSGFLRNWTNEVKRELQNGTLGKRKKEEELWDALLMDSLNKAPWVIEARMASEGEPIYAQT